MGKGKHPGFNGAMRGVERREGVSPAAAARIIGSNKAHASAAAKARNPRLMRQGGRGGRGR